MQFLRVFGFVLLGFGILFGSNHSTNESGVYQNQGEPLINYGPAFNAAAIVNVNRLDSCVSGFIDASFIYWKAGEEGLSLATTGALNASTLYYTQNTETLLQSFDYKPGFQVGLGVVIQNEWALRGGYTWFRARNTTNSGNPLSGTISTAGSEVLSGNSVWIVNDWFLQGTPVQALPASRISSIWRLHMDLMDLAASRPFYQGRRLIVTPFGGLRSALIRQSMTVNLTEVAGFFAQAPSQPIQSHNRSNSWSIGPRGGCDVQCLLPMGWRIESSCAIALLYTKYTSVKHSEDAASLTYNRSPFKASYSDYSSLRPELDLGLGFGWGMYIRDQKYWIDFSADFDFMLFWNQNMMRKLLDDTLTGTGPASGDLYLYGLTLSGAFYF